MTKRVTKIGLSFIGQPAPKWLIKLLTSWMAIAGLTKVFLKGIGISDDATAVTDAVFIYVGGLITIFVPITGTQDVKI